MLHEIAFMLKRKRAFEGYKKRSEFGFDKSKLTFLKFLAGYMYNQYKESQKNQNFIFLA